MKGTYWLTDSERDEYTPLLQEFIGKCDNSQEETLELSNTKLNPATTKQLLEELGFIESDDMETNGWQMDFWITMNHDEHRAICISGCGFTSKLLLRVAEDY